MIKGTFISIWDDGVEITTPATLDPQSGYVDTTPVDVEGLEILTEERFVSENGDEYEICPECHEYIIVTVIRENSVTDTVLDEIKICKDAYCPFNDK